MSTTPPSPVGDAAPQPPPVPILDSAPRQWGDGEERTRLVLKEGTLRMGAELAGRIILPSDTAIPGSGQATLTCRRRQYVKSRRDGARVEETFVSETIERLLDGNDWVLAEGRWSMEVRFPIRGQYPSSGPTYPDRSGAPSYLWILEVHVEGSVRRTFEFILPVLPGVAAPDELPPAVAAAVADPLGAGNPAKILEHAFTMAAEAAPAAEVPSVDRGAVFNSAGISELSFSGAVGGKALAMSPEATGSIRTAGFLSAVVGTIAYGAIGFGALFLISVPVLGWLLALAGVAFAAHGIWCSFLTAREAANASAEVLWVEAGVLCRATGDGQQRIAREQIDRLEVEDFSSVGAIQFVRLVIAHPPEPGRKLRKRTLWVAGIRGAEAGAAVAGWLQQCLGSDVPIVRTRQGQQYGERLHDLFSSPTKR